MSTTTITELRPAIDVELTSLSSNSTHELEDGQRSNGQRLGTPKSDDFGAIDSGFSTSAIPDGGFGWVVVFCGSLITFWNNGMINCWGILQTALLNSTLSDKSTSTVSFIGALNLAAGPAFQLPAARLGKRFGSRATSMMGVMLTGLGLIAASWCTTNLAGLFVTIGIVSGIGISSSYSITNTLPVQYFSAKIGLANGLVKLGGGIGGTVMAIALEALVRRVGIAWTFRIQGIMTIAAGLPAAYFMKDRVSTRNTPAPFLDFSMFRNGPFVFMFISGAIGTFALFVPPYYLPLFVESLGKPASTGAALVAAFNACNGLGRFIGGPMCDMIGATNTFVIMILLNAISMLAIWPVSSSLAPLILFAILNGIVNGAYFTVFPTMVSKPFGPGRASAAMSVSISGWTAGYLMGGPIAGFLLQAADGKEGGEQQSIDAFRPAIFYAGGIALVSSLFAIVARFKMSRSMLKRV